MLHHTSALPFVSAALRRHLEQFSLNGRRIVRTERQALSVLRERGPLSGGQLYVAVQRLEEQIFTGDGSLKRLVGGKG